MKITFIGQKGIPATWGGVEEHVDQLSRRIAARGANVVVYNRGHYASNEDAQQYVSQYKRMRAVTVPTIASKHLDAILHTFVATIHAMLFEKPDVYHYHGVGPSLMSFLPRIFRPSARVITTFHSPDRLHQKWNWFARAVLTAGEWTALKFAHETLTVSHALQQYSDERYALPSTYIPNGVEMPEHKAPELIKTQFGLEANEYILVVSRLVRHKGIHYLIDAFKWLDTQKKLVIVGGSAKTDEYVAELHALAADDDRVIFTGYQTGDVLQELFSNTYLYVQPSESEGLSVAVLEAASYGNAVLASDIPANSEIIRGRGFEFQNTNVSDLRAKLKKLLQQPEKVIESGRELQQHIAREYNWEHIADDVFAVYRKQLTRMPQSMASKRA